MHSHSEAVIPFSVSSVPLRPIFHMGGVMGAQAPVYDIANHYSSSDKRHDLLIGSQSLGASLAACFSPSTSVGYATHVIKSFVTSGPSSAVPDFPTHPTVLSKQTHCTCRAPLIRSSERSWVYLCRYYNRRSSLSCNLHMHERAGANDQFAAPGRPQYQPAQ